MSFVAIPPDQRISYVNRLLGEAGTPAAEGYARAKAAYKSPFDLAQVRRSESEQDTFYWVADNAAVLALRDDWPPDRCAAVQEWLGANTAAIDALCMATEHEHATLHLEAGPENRLTWAVPFARLADWRMLCKLAAVHTCHLARTGQWENAYAWNLRIQRMGAHLRMSPWLIARANGNVLARFGCEQLRGMLGMHVPPNLQYIVAALRHECNRTCDDALVEQVGGLIVADELDLNYAWARDPTSQPKLQEGIAIQLALREEQDPARKCDALLNDRDRSAEVEAYRRALLHTPLEAYWPVDAELCRVYQEWRRRPLHEALAVLPQFRQQYESIARGHPYAAMWFVGGLPAIGADVEGRAALEGELAAIETIAQVLKHQREHGELLESLDTLAAMSQLALTLDPVSGRNLTYAILSAGASFELRGAAVGFEAWAAQEIAPLRTQRTYWPPEPPDYCNREVGREYEP